MLRALTALAGIGVAVVLVAVAELAARVLDPLSPQEQTNRDAFDYQAWTLGPCYRASSGQLVPVRPPREFVASGGETFSVAKPSGVRRIVVVGESTGEMLENELVRLTQGARDRVEVLRCSASGSRPFITVRRVEEALAWSPDAIVVAIGHNFMLPGPPSQAQLNVNRSRLVHEAERLLPPRPVVMAPPKSGPRTLNDLDPPAMGRAAYEQILALAKPKGVQVVAVVLSSNLLLRPNAGPGDEASLERARALVRWAQSDLTAAIQLLSVDSPLKAFDRGLLHAQAGDWAAAKADLERARDLEPMPTRASTAVTKGIVDAARSGGATVVDVETLFAPLADHGIPGWEIYFDNCHPRPAPLRQLATAVLATVVPPPPLALREAPPEPKDLYSSLVTGPSSLQLPMDTPSLESMRRRIDGPVTLLLRQHPTEAADILQRYDREVLRAASKSVAALTLTAVGATARDNGRLDIARWCDDRVIAEGATAEALLDRALLNLHDHKDVEARADLKQAREIDPQHPLAKALAEVLP